MMSRYFTINLTSGTSPGPYTIYYDVVSAGNIAIVMDTTILASGLTSTQLGFGVTVTVPDTAIKIIVYNEYCDTSEVFILSPKNPDYPCLCMTIDILLKESLETKQYEFCPNGAITNGKPEYQSTTSSEKLVWDINGYWEFLNQEDGYIYRSNYNNNIPVTGWYGVGLSTPNSTITVEEGLCVQGKPLYNLTVTEYYPTCQNSDDGGLVALAIGGLGGWSYSLNGIDYSNTTGIFTSLSEGTYTVFAQDSGGTITSKTVILTGQTSNFFTIVGNYTISTLPSTNNGNMKYYMATINYNTSNIPSLETINLDLRMVYNLTYTQPGTVIFDTAQHYVTLNGNPQTILQLSSTPLAINGAAPCNPSYNRYVGQNTYSTNLTISNGDILTVNLIWGINTTTNGQLIGACFTTAQVNLDVYFENPAPSCDCCSFVGNAINIPQPLQIYQP